MTHDTATVELRGMTRLAGLKERLIDRPVVTVDLMRALEAGVGMAPTLRGRFNALVEAGAWTDAALALIDGALPGWKLRRLVYDEGEWHCALSQRSELPDWLDDAAEGSHASRSVALLLAVIEAVRQTPSPGHRSGVVPRVMPARDDLICCENFA